MKKIYNVMMLAAVAVAALVSCAKEINKPELAPQSEGIKVTLSTGAITKTYIEGTTPKWKATDAVGVFTGTNEVNAQFLNTEADGEAAVFNGSVPEVGTYYAYYPYSTSGASDAGALVKIPETQYPTPTSFDGAADLLLSESFEIASTSSEDISVKFRRLGGFLKFSFIDGTTGARLTGEHATEVRVIVSNADDTKRPCPSVRITPTGFGTIGGGMKTIVASYAADAYELTASGNATWFGVYPQTFLSGSTFAITITTDSYTISKTLTLSSDVELGAGDILPINVSLTDVEVPLKQTKIVKLWEKLSTSETNWFAAIGGTAGSDFNIAIDNQNVYIPSFGGSKKLLAVDIATGNTVTEVNTSTVESVGYDGSIFLSCARVVKKNDGSPVLLATNLFQDGETATGRLYIWDNGINNAPAVKTLQQWNAGRRLGDTWTTYGNYEDCWLIMSTHAGNTDGFVTFKVPTGSTSYLTSRLAISTGDFCSYYPFPGDLTHGMFTWRGGVHDDGLAYRNRLMTVNSTEAAIKTEGAHTSELSKLSTWMANYENNNGSGFNFIEFNGKRYAIWVINMADSKTFDIVVKEGSTSTPWNTIIDTSASAITSAGGFAFRESLVGGQAVTWKQGTDCAVWNNGDEVYIAVNKVNVGLAVYKMYAE